MPRTKVSLKGHKAFARLLRRLEEKEFKKALRKGLRKGAKTALSLARARAPTKTGALKRSLKVKATKRSRVRVGVKIQLPERESLSIRQGAGYYPAAQEFGASGAGRGRNATVPEVDYLRSSHAAAVPKTIRAIKRELIAAIRRQAARVKKR